MRNSLDFLFDAGGIWFVIVCLCMAALLVVTILAFVNPCALSHLEGFLGQSFCDFCGVQLRPYCPVCFISHHPAAVFCSECGSPLVEVPGDE